MATPARPSIDTSPLPAAAAASVERLLGDLCRRHPQLRGFALKGSFYDSTEQLPDPDVDINWLGDLPEDHGDERLGFRQVFLVDQTQVDLATWFWNDIDQAETASLTTAVSLARCHILWERDDAFSRPRAAARRLLRDAEWVGTKVDEELQAYRRTLDRWRDPAQRQPFGASWDYARQVCTVWGLSLLSSCLLRPPSAQRKGLMEVILRSRSLGLPWFGAMSTRALGCSDLQADEVRDWLASLMATRQRLSRAIADNELAAEVDDGSLRYHCSGIESMLAQGLPAAAAWPLWRALHLLANRFASVLPTATTEAVQFRQRLGLTDLAVIDQRLPCIAEAVERLADERDRLVTSVLHHSRQLWPTTL